MGELLKAFSNFQKVHRENVSKEAPSASKMEVKRELGRRWKLLGEKQKLKYLDSNFSPKKVEKKKILKDLNHLSSRIKREVIQEELVTVTHKVKDEFCDEEEEKTNPYYSEETRSHSGGDD